MMTMKSRKHRSEEQRNENQPTTPIYQILVELITADAQVIEQRDPHFIRGVRVPKADVNV